MTLQNIGMLVLRQLLWERGHGLCGICHDPVAVEIVSIDHIVPRARGGSDDLANLQASHQSCNSRKGIHDKPRNRPARQLRMRLAPPVGTQHWPVSKPNLPDLAVDEIVEPLTVDFVAAKLRVKPKTIRKWIKLGTIKRATMVNRRAGWLIPSAEVDRLLPKPEPT